MRNAPDQLEEFLSAFEPGISKLFFATRRVVWVPEILTPTVPEILAH